MSTSTSDSTRRRPAARSRRPQPGRGRNARRHPDKGRRGLPVVPLAVAFVLLAAVLAVALGAGGEDAGGDETSQFGRVTVRGEALASLGAAATGGADPAVGASAPALSGADFDGTPVALPSDARPTLVVFAAHWCPHCQAEMPRLVDWMAAGGGEGVDVVAVSTAANPEAPNWTPQAWLEREGWEAPVLVDDADGAAAAAYGVDGYPFFALVDAGGAVVWRASGAIGPQALDAVLAAHLG